VTRQPAGATSTPSKTTTALLLSLRIFRRWNQSGQKYAGSSDIAGTFHNLPSVLLWLLLTLTFYDMFGRISRRSLEHSGLTSGAAGCGASLLVGTALTFKVVFTSNDEPELLGKFDWLGASHLLTLAQLVFYWSILSFVYILIARVRGKDREIVFKDETERMSPLNNRR